MSLEEVKKAIEDNSLPVSIADKYLKLYVADIDWIPHITALWKNATNKFSKEDVAKDYIKRAIACATILPLVEKIQIPDPPKNLLFWCTGWKQFEKEDWFNLFIDVLKEDVQIQDKRNKIIQLGVIDRIDVSPITRQAYNWLHASAEETGVLNESNKKELELKFSNLVRSYGGAVICNIFVNHKLNIDKVFNWRSGYFFEKQIHKVYSLDQIKKIKLAEFNKMNSKYIKKVGVQNV